MKVGYVAKNQVPLLFTFDEGKAEQIVDMMVEGLEYMYEYVSYFQFEEDEYGD